LLIHEKVQAAPSALESLTLWRVNDLNLIITKGYNEHLVRARPHSQALVPGYAPGYTQCPRAGGGRICSTSTAEQLLLLANWLRANKHLVRVRPHSQVLVPGFALGYTQGGSWVLPQVPGDMRLVTGEAGRACTNLGVPVSWLFAYLTLCLGSRLSLG
jgi:hypothetical protein